MTDPTLLGLPVIHVPPLCRRHAAELCTLHERLTGETIMGLTPVHHLAIGFLVHLAIADAGLPGDRPLTAAEVHQLHASMLGWGLGLCCRLAPLRWAAVVTLAGLHSRSQPLGAFRS